MQFISLESTQANGITQVEKIGEGEVTAVVTITKEGTIDDTLSFAKARFMANEKGVSYIMLGSNSAAGTAGERYQVEPGSTYVVIE